MHRPPNNHKTPSITHEAESLGKATLCLTYTHIHREREREKVCMCGVCDVVCVTSIFLHSNRFKSKTNTSLERRESIRERNR